MHFFRETLSRLGTSIFAGSLVSCLVSGHIESLHIALLLLGVFLTALGYPIASGKDASR